MTAPIALHMHVAKGEMPIDGLVMDKVEMIRHWRIQKDLLQGI